MLTVTRGPRLRSLHSRPRTSESCAERGYIAATKFVWPEGAWRIPRTEVERFRRTRERNGSAKTRSLGASRERTRSVTAYCSGAVAPSSATASPARAGGTTRGIRALEVGRLVFASHARTPLAHRNIVRRGLEKAAESAKLDHDGKPKLRWHDLRHTAASLLTGQGLNVVYGSRALGRADPSITLSRYAHVWDAVEHGERATEAMGAAFGDAGKQPG